MRNNGLQRNLIAGWNMANQPHQFKHRDVVRAFKAAAAAGVTDPKIEFQLPNGTTIVIGGGTGNKTNAAASTPNKTRPAAPRSAAR
jgi:hypothetical protein